MNHTLHLDVFLQLLSIQTLMLNKYTKTSPSLPASLYPGPFQRESKVQGVSFFSQTNHRPPDPEFTDWQREEAAAARSPSSQQGGEAERFMPTTALRDTPPSPAQGISLRYIRTQVKGWISSLRVKERHTSSLLHGGRKSILL